MTNYNAAGNTQSSGSASGESVTREEVVVINDPAVLESIAQSVATARQGWREHLRGPGRSPYVHDGEYRAGVRSESALSVRQADLRIAGLSSDEPSATLNDVSNGSNFSNNSRYVEFNAAAQNGGRRFVRVFDSATATGRITHTEDVVTVAADGTVTAVHTHSMFDQISGRSSERATNIAPDDIPGVIESAANLVTGAIEEYKPVLD